ncbi:MAG: NADH-quinone oxidoreductase subunit NuoB [Alphaproteobacteria bacterium]|nr:NADH-quinone oxidoreductase subunit NuoB [Alphaproteobacteria bacterium]
MSEVSDSSSPEQSREQKTSFFVTTMEKLADWARCSSIWISPFATSCCGVEMKQADLYSELEHLGAVFKKHHSKADVLVIAGAINGKTAPVLRSVYEQMPEPKWVIAMGACAINGGVYNQSYSVVEGCDKVVPVDVYVEGCPPKPEAFIQGIIKLKEKIKRIERQ